MAKIQLRKVLNSSDVLYVSKKSNNCKKTLNILNLFFHSVIEARNATDALKAFVQSRPSAIITDIDLPKIDGIEFIKAIRRTNDHIPIIILSYLKDEKYLFEAIKLKLTDYLLKPVDVTKLIGALNSVAKIISHDYSEIIFPNDFKYSFITKNVTTNDNKILHLTKNEYRLLELFIENQHNTLSKSEIIHHLWSDNYITDSAFKSLFSRLRQKIGKDTISNNFGVGYNLQLHD